MPDPLRPLRVNALELLREPGTVREVRATIEAAPLEVHHESLAGDIDVDLRLESTNDAIEVTGEITVPWAGVCRRCLAEVRGRARAEVHERFSPEPTDDDAFPIEQQRLDLAPMTRQLALLELADERLCREECRGLCPVCGADRNVDECACDTSVRDERWAALDDLVIED